jgi:hypothetical protein
MTLPARRIAAYPSPQLSAVLVPDDLSETVSIPESGNQRGSFDLLVLVSEIDRHAVAPGLLRQVSLDDVSPHLR